MGLDFDKSDAHWSYSGFNRFRERLAHCIGIDLNKMESFGGDIPWSTIKSGIVPLLNHSDCDGKLTPAEMKQIAPALFAIVSLWEDSYDKQQALLLVADMNVCIKDKAPLEFC